MSILRSGYLAVAQKLQEAATAMCHADIQTRISDALNDAFRGTGTWAYLVAVFGDDKAGDCVYSCGGDLKKAAYTISGANCTIDTLMALDVMPLTTYEVETADVEATEAGARNSKRDQNQLQFIHDATTALGATCAMKEAAPVSGGALKLTESAATCETIVLQEAKADYEIKLIAPGKGSSAFYPAEVLKRDGPNVFKSGTHVYLNHQTAAEEAARPEGDVKNLAGVLTTTAHYEESHAKGPGLYARMKVFADHAQMVEDKAAHVGMSIRASGVAEASRRQEGLPVLKELTSAESVDVVTRAGAGGMILTEAARGAETPTQEASMDADELKLLRESVALLSGKETRREAIQEGARILRDVSLPDSAKEYVIETVLKEALPMKDGSLDTVKFAESVNAEAKRFAGAIGGGSRVTGMGAAPPVELTEAQRTAQANAAKADDEMYKESWATLLDGDVKLAEHAVRGRAN